MKTEFKKFSELKELDKRNFYFVRIDKDGIHHITLEDFYNNVASIKLYKIVPEDIITQFDVAKNLIVYSCFVYRFHQPAKMQIYSTMELALKDVFNITKDNPKSFKKMIKDSIKLGLIKDDDFKSMINSNGFCKKLLEFVPYIRNELAHGDSSLMNNSIGELAMCKNFINQLYKNKGLIKK